MVGGYVYRGSAPPQMAGRYLYTDVASANLWALAVDGNANVTSNTIVADNLVDTFSLGEDEAGELYAASQEGTIYRFVLSDAADKAVAAMPGTLSATGLFTDLAQLRPAPDLIDYDVNSPLWSDGARKRRWFVLPDTETLRFSADGAWGFPQGTITVKHFELLQAGGAVRRLETRVMVNRPEGWIGYTYRWRDDQRDADLLLDGASASYDTVNPCDRRQPAHQLDLSEPGAMFELPHAGHWPRVGHQYAAAQPRSHLRRHGPTGQPVARAEPHRPVRG